jgi:hypothetical protein
MPGKNGVADLKRHTLPIVQAGPDNITHSLLDPTVKIKSVSVQPVQFHFHALSEHTVNGMYVCSCFPQMLMLSH